MQKTKRALSILLSIVMILSLFTIIPTSAGAAIVDPAATGDGDTIRIYAVNYPNWGNIYVYFWGSATNCEWTTYQMTSYSGSKVYYCDIPADVSGLLLNNGYSGWGNQTEDFTNLSNESVLIINSDVSSYIAPEYYLRGNMNGWSNNSDYKLSIYPSSAGVYEYKLTNVQFDKDAEFKITDGSKWYPDSNHIIDVAGKYDVYFRPEKNNDWSEKYIYVKNVTPYTITWMNGDDVLKEDTVTYGNTPSYDGVIPTRPETATSSTLDVFVGWEEEIVPATENAVYHANFITKDRFDGHSISLNGDIAINYYIHLTDDELAEGKTVTFDWTVNGRQNKVEHTIVATDQQADGRYKVSCPVAVAEMNYPVTASIELCGETVTNIYSVKTYADYILSDAFKETYDVVGPKCYDNLSALVTAMLNYGAMAQLKFNRTDFDLANDKGEEYSPEDIPESQVSDPEVPYLSEYGLTYSGSTVVFLSKTSLRHYFTCEDVAALSNLSISFGEKTNVEYKTKGDEIYFELSDIAAAKLSTRFSLTFNNDNYEYSVIDYARACVNSDTMAENMKKLAKATYWYSEAADAYFA